MRSIVGRYLRVPSHDLDSEGGHSCQLVGIVLLREAQADCIRAVWVVWAADELGARLVKSTNGVAHRSSEAPVAKILHGG